MGQAKFLRTTPEAALASGIEQPRRRYCVRTYRVEAGLSHKRKVGAYFFPGPVLTIPVWAEGAVGNATDDVLGLAGI
jgi:hypothetical protein